jgi:hypothetical protein
MDAIWMEMQKLAGSEIHMRELHDAVDEMPGTRVVPHGKSFERDGRKFQPVMICRNGFRPINVIAFAN